MANKFTPFRPGKLGDLDSSYTQKICIRIYYEQ